MSMTQIWIDDKVMAVTPVLAGPCPITQIKTKNKDGYEALQLAFGEKKEKNVNKPQRGHVKALGIMPRHLKEFRVAEVAKFQVGDVVTIETFVIGDKINATGTSKGKGFQGVVKRHGFAGFRKTHGNKDQERMPGSIGPKGPAHVFKGTRMGGRMGNEQVTVANLEIVKVDVENNIIFVKGALPGAINGLVTLKGAGELQVNLKKTSAPIIQAEEVTAEKVATEAITENQAAPLKTKEAPEALVQETPVQETPAQEAFAQETVAEEAAALTAEAVVPTEGQKK